MAGKNGRRMAARAAGQAKAALAETQFTATLAGLEVLLRATARRYPSFADRLRERDLVAQIRLAGRTRGRAYTIRGGKVRSRAGLHPAPDLTMTFDTAEVAVRVMKPGRDYLEFIDALKNFQMRVEGPDDLAVWFSETLQMMLTAGLEYGVDAGGGVRRFTTNTNGGPVFVYVRDGRILRITPIEFDEDDAEPWTIEARGHRFTPPRKTTVNSHTLAWKSLIYSPDRLLYPMKRVDFDPDGERNPQNRGTSGYERISWDEALDLVASEIKRVKRDHGPGAIMNGSGSHHTWGVLGYWLSARIRFFNMVGWSPVMHNPDSWEGWYWGAAHHWGQSARNGGGETYGTVEDLLKHAEMVVFWSSDPEATSGVYGAHDGTVRRQWLKELGIPCVHIDPFHNHTAQFLGGKWIAPRPGTDSAMVLAIAHVWMTEGLYDEQYVAERTEGFEKWKAYILGEEDGVARTPEWQEAETGVPARDLRALARAWGTKEDLSRRRRPRRLRRRLPHRHRHRLGARRRLPHGHAGPGQARREHGLPAAGHAARHALLLPRLRRGRLLRRPHRHRAQHQHVPAHAAARHGQHRLAGRAAPQDPRGGAGRPLRGVSHRPEVHRGPVPALRVPGAGPQRGQDVLQVRRLPLRHHDRHQPLRAHVPLGQARVRGQPGHLDGGGDQVRRRHPARPAPTSSAGTSASSPTAAATSSTRSRSATTASP